MLRLRTLGGVYVSADDGSPLAGAAGQRRLLALLAILAASGESGVSRDRLLGLLWPEGDLEKARHALTQSMYHARRSLREEELFLSSGDQVRLNAACLASDVADIELALAQGDLSRAAELYGGPFLDDFFVPGAGDLDRWRSSTAQRLSERMATAFDTLARRASATGDAESSVRWRRRQVEIDPLNTTAARQFVESLETAGDRAGAVRQGQIHQALLKAELNLEPDAAFSALVERLRTPQATSPDVAAESAIEPEATAPLAPRHLPINTSATTPGEVRAARRWTPRLLAGVVAAVALVTLTVLMRARPDADAHTPPTDQKVIVAPFRVSGADPSVAFLKEGLVELLSTRLNDDTVAQPVDPGAVLQAWRNNRLLQAAEVPPTEIARVARRLGADAVVTGSVVGDPKRVVISASLMDARTGVLRATVNVAGTVDGLPLLVDHVAGSLLATNAGEAERFADRMTPSLPALRAYLGGQAAYHKGDYASAIQFYERALRLDSTFALAAMRLALAADHRNSADQHDRALALAWQNRADLTERDLLHLIAFAGPRYPAPSTEAEQLAAWEDAVALSPDRAEIWTELGERFFYNGRLLDIPDADRRAATALRKALDLDPNEASARRLLTLLASRSRDTATLRTLASPAALRDSTGSLGRFLAWRVAQSRNDARELARIRSAFADLDDANLRAIAMASQFDGIGVDDGARALRVRSLRPMQPAEQMDVILARHSLALNQGDAVLALDLTEQLEEKQPGSRAHLRLRVLDALYGRGDTSAARAAAKALGRIADAPAVTGSTARPLQLADVCVISQWRLARGEVGGISQAIAQLRSPTAPRTSLPIASNPHTCADLLDAGLAVRTRSTGARARVARLDSLMLAGPAVSDAGAYAPIFVARLYEQLGDPVRALAAVRRRPYMSGWPRYLVASRDIERKLAAAVAVLTPRESAQARR